MPLVNKYIKSRLGGMKTERTEKTAAEMVAEIRADGYMLMITGFCVGLEVGMMLQEEIEKARATCPWLFEVLNGCIKK